MVLELRDALFWSELVDAEPELFERRVLGELLLDDDDDDEDDDEDFSRGLLFSYGCVVINLPSSSPLPICCCKNNTVNKVLRPHHDPREEKGRNEVGGRGERERERAEEFLLGSAAWKSTSRRLPRSRRSRSRTRHTTF